VTMDLKKPGNSLYLIGETRDELGGSHFALVNHLNGGQVPHVDLQRAPKLYQAVHNAIEAGLIRSCHDCSEGGLAVAVAEMAFAGGVGVQVDLQNLVNATGISCATVLLFSESNTRWVVEVTPDSAVRFEQTFEGLPLTKLGQTVAATTVEIRSPNGSTIVNSTLADLKSSWQKPLAWN